MLLVDGYYLYQIGSEIHSLTDLSEKDDELDIYYKLMVAESKLEQFLSTSVYDPKSSLQSGIELLNVIKHLIEFLNKQNDTPLKNFHFYDLHKCVTEFEAVLKAELSVTPLFLPIQKGAFDIRLLVENGNFIFPADTMQKVPEAISDLKQAARCLIFDLPTACAFHLFRAFEYVLRKYYLNICSKNKPLKNASIGKYIQKLEKIDAVDPKILSSLRDLKNLHRNPVIHPDISLSSSEEAISLIGILYTLFTYMLKEIDLPEQYDEHIKSYQQLTALSEQS